MATLSTISKPKALRKGDQIRIVTPASPVTPEKIEAGVKQLEDWGFRVTLSNYAMESHGYLSGSDQDRASDLMQAFDDPEVRMVYCSRGGYGCARLFPLLDLDRMARSEKLFAGFSDVTTLHVALNNRGMPTLHAPMPLTLSTPRETWVYRSLHCALTGAIDPLEDVPRGEPVAGGVTEGTVVGGCLCLLCDTIGTPEALQTKDKILIIEDVDESPHRVDAMLTHLLNSGLAQEAAGIVIGEMTRTDEKVDGGIGGVPWRAIVHDRLGGLGIPVMIGYPFGHMPNMLTLGLGVRARMDADAGTLAYLETVCDA